MIKLSVFLYILCVTPVYAVIYQWTDKNGMLQFGDCRPEKCGSKLVEMDPLVLLHSDVLPENLAQSSKETAGKNQLQPQKIATERTTPDLIPSFGLKPPLKRYQCHQSPEQMQDPDWAILNVGVLAEPLTNGDAAEVRRFLYSLKGTWKGDLKEHIFKKKLAKQVSLHSDYTVSARIDKSRFDQVLFDIDVNRRSGNEERTGLKSVEYWMMLDKERVLRSGNTLDSNPDTMFKKAWVNQYVAWNDGRLEVIKNFRGPGGGAIRRLSYKFFERRNKQLLITECLYTQGYIESIRSWTLKNRL